MSALLPVGLKVFFHMFSAWSQGPWRRFLWVSVENPSKVTPSQRLSAFQLAKLFVTFTRHLKNLPGFCFLFERFAAEFDECRVEAALKPPKTGSRLCPTLHFQFGAAKIVYESLPSRFRCSWRQWSDFKVNSDS